MTEPVPPPYPTQHCATVHTSCSPAVDDEHRDFVWDLVVVGAGPAGCAAAAYRLALDPSARVLILDKATFPRDKCCGDGITAEALDALRGAQLDVDSLVCGYRPTSAFTITSPSGVTIIRDTTHKLYAIPRKVFDARLLEAVRRRGAVYRTLQVRSLQRERYGVLVNSTIRTRVLIGADGAESTVRRLASTEYRLTLSPRANSTLAVAIRGYGPHLPDQSGRHVLHLADRRWPAYAWSFPVGSDTANLGYGQLLDTREPVTRAGLLRQLTEIMPGAEPDPNTLRAARLPLSNGRRRIADGNVLLVGDALSLVNPLTGEGIFYAIVSGALAAAAAATAGAVDAGARYRMLLTQRLGRHWRHAGLLAWLSRWPALMDAVLRSAAHRQDLYDDIADLGLSDGTITARLLRGAARPQHWHDAAEPPTSDSETPHVTALAP